MYDQYRHGEMVRQVAAHAAKKKPAIKGVRMLKQVNPRSKGRRSRSELPVVLDALDAPVSDYLVIHAHCAVERINLRKGVSALRRKGLKQGNEVELPSEVQKRLRDAKANSWFYADILVKGT